LSIERLSTDISRFSRTVVLFLLLAIVMMVGGARSMKVENGFASYAMIQPLYIGAIIVGFVVVIARRLLLSPLTSRLFAGKGGGSAANDDDPLAGERCGSGRRWGWRVLLVFRVDEVITSTAQQARRWWSAAGNPQSAAPPRVEPRGRHGLTAGDTQNRREQV
jgi:hypothetical protein